MKKEMNREHLFMEMKKRRREYLTMKLGKSLSEPRDIHTKDFPGGLYIREGGNGMPDPVYLEISDIDELKSLISPDELVEAYGEGDLHKNLRGMNKKADERMLLQMDALEREDLCRAFTQYVYGHSRFADTYREALNLLYFKEPMKIPVMEYQDIYVKKDIPLHIGKPGGGATVTVCRNVIMEEGAKIIFEGESVLDAEAIQNEGMFSDLFSCGASGQPGGKGQDGKDGDDGEKGTRGTDDKDCCKTNATDGGTGKPGVDGGPAPGCGDGKPGSPVLIDVPSITGSHYVFSYGGDGGKGGTGGNGGKGGNGGDAGGAAGHCKKSDPGKGGKGGNGGKGGKGGEGGNGNTVIIRFLKDLSPDVQFTLLSPQKARELGYCGGFGGEKGEGGLPGEGGIGGQMYDNAGTLVPSGSDYTGSKGKKGGDGDSGNAGIPGEITINGRIVE